MPQPRFRSRTFRRIFRKTASKTTLRYKRRRPKKLTCNNCDTLLHGIPQLNPGKLNRLSKSKKRPERRYGGNLCPNCTQRKIISEVRS